MADGRMDESWSTGTLFRLSIQELSAGYPAGGSDPRLVGGSAALHVGLLLPATTVHIPMALGDGTGMFYSSGMQAAFSSIGSVSRLGLDV